MAQFQPKRLASYSDHDLINEIKRVAQTFFNDRCIKREEFDRHSRVHSSTVRKRFGSWTNAMQKAGYLRRSERTAVEDLKHDLLRMKQLSKGNYFTQQFYEENGGRFHPRTLMRGLGYPNWSALLDGALSLRNLERKRVVVQKRRPAPPTDLDLLEELRRVWDLHGRRPSYTEFQREGRLPVSRYESRFGSWVTTVEIFCAKFAYPIKAGKGSHVTKAMLKAELQSIAEKSKGPRLDHPTYLKLGGTYCTATFMNHFGSWRKAVESVGRSAGPVGARNLSNEDFFGELQRVWETLGRQPTASEMKSLGNISAKSFHVRFGSWTKAIHAFCEDRADTGVDECNVLGSSDTSAISSYDASNRPFAVPQVAPSAVTAATDDEMPQVIERSRLNAAHAEAEAGVEYIVMTTPRLPSPKLRFRVLSRDCFRCVYCGRGPASHPDVVLHVDHKTAYSRGGETIFDNLQATCSVCNLGKSDSGDK
jgi:hypothetical protein